GRDWPARSRCVKFELARHAAPAARPDSEGRPSRSMSAPPRILWFAAPRGFCAGVDRAIDIVDMALEIYGAPIYVRHECVHNRHVVEDLRRKGAIFTDDLSEVPTGAVVIFSAHGVSPAVRAEANARGLRSL